MEKSFYDYFKNKTNFLGGFKFINFGQMNFNSNDDPLQPKTFENIKLLDHYNAQIKYDGCIYLTRTHFIFTSSEAKLEVWIYYTWISAIDKQPLNTNGSPLQIKCKTFLNCTFIIQNERDCQTLYSHLTAQTKPSRLEDLPCFLVNSDLELMKSTGYSKKIFDLKAEFLRMGVPNKDWTLTQLNNQSGICDTYPALLYVPTSASTAMLKASASFRSRGRLPTLSYLHSNNSSICRCSQPLAGFSARCIEDEQLFDCILKTNKNSSFMYIIDTRPKINAIANRAQGKGYENENNYSNVQFYFFGIENIHVMRGSLQKLLEVCEIANPTTSQYLSALDKCDWFKHIKIILETANFIMEAVHVNNVNVVVHCSDGWDRTAQTCALSSLLLDPYYRTIHGFQILIEKEWLSFGHKFTERCGHLDSDSKETSPIFTQFLDCIWQLQQQFPCSFEFNEIFLIHIHDHVYSCQFGTFIGNCEKDRIDLKLAEKTYSLWDYLQNNLNSYLNPLYKPNSEFSREVLKADTRLQMIRLWTSMYNRFDRGVNQQENPTDMLVVMKDHISSLEDHLKLLEKRHEELTTLLSQEPKTVENTKKDLNLDQLAFELNSLSLDWKSVRNSFKCKCYYSLDYMAKKKHCWQCGELYCHRCVTTVSIQFNQNSVRNISLCQKCRKNSTTYLVSINDKISPANNQFSINNSDNSA